MALALGEDGDQDIGAGHFLAAGGLDMDRRALQHALEAGGGLGLAAVVGDQIAELAVDVVDEVAAQALDIDTAGPHHRDGIRILGQRQQEMLERREFMPALIGIGERPVQRLLEIGRQHRALLLLHRALQRMLVRRAKSMTWVTLVSATS